MKRSPGIATAAPRKRRTIFWKNRVLASIAVAGFASALFLPNVLSSSAAYVDASTANLKTLGIPGAFSLEVMTNNSGGTWSPATTEATAAVVKPISDQDSPAGALSKPLIVSSSVRVSSASTTKAAITPTIRPPSICTGPCASVYDYVRVSAWWGTQAQPQTTLITPDASVNEFNALTNRSIVGAPGVEQLLTIRVTLDRPPFATYNGVETTIGIAYNGVTDSKLG